MTTTNKLNSSSEEQDVIRAEGEGMLSSEVPRTPSKPRVEKIALLKAHGGAYVRRFRHVELPVMRSRVVSQVISRPLTSLALAMVAGIGLGVGVILLARGKSSSEN